MTAAQKASGNEVRDYYDRYWSSPDERRYLLDEELVRLLRQSIDPTSRCLDVGCGAGQTYAELVSSSATSYTGVDISAKAVELARSRGLDAELIDDAGALPFADESFDMAICFEVLEHLSSPHLALGEVHRVLRSGGRLVATAPNSAYWRLRANLLFGLWNPAGDSLAIEQPWRDPHIRFFTLSTLRRMLEHAGFSVVQIGAHGGCLLDHLTSRPTNFGVSRAYRRAEAVFPTLLGATIHALGVK